MLSIGVIGGGPAALMFLKKVTKELQPVRISIFEAGSRLGCGMPYSEKGASAEHVTNISSDELPPFDVSLADWISTVPDETLAKFGIDKSDFHEKEVVPRLLFGMFLEDQFYRLIEEAKDLGFVVDVHLDSRVMGIAPGDGQIVVTTEGTAPVKTQCTASADTQGVQSAENQGTAPVKTQCHQLAKPLGKAHYFDKVILCTGHQWPREHEGKLDGYFDSPYPPQKLAKRFNHTVAVRGSSLTAVDAIKTMARANGSFREVDGRLVFEANDDSKEFRIEMHSKQGLLPCLRVHMEEPYIKKNAIISKEEIERDIEKNDGFLQLDFLYEKAFKAPLQESDPAFYQTIKDLTLEQFIDKMMSYRTQKDAFELFGKEYEQSLKSIEQEKPVAWKEMLAALSIALNYPAKHMSAEDMMRLQKHLIPLVSTVIAFIPQSSANVLLAMHDAGRLELIADGDSGKVEVVDGKIFYSWENEKREYQTFVDCIGQRPLEQKDFPFSDLVDDELISSARLKFRDRSIGEKMFDEGKKQGKKQGQKQGNENVVRDGDDYFLCVPGMDISDNFQLVNKQGIASDSLFLMAVPFMGGLNPDYSGLDFCENAAGLIVEYLKNGMISKAEQLSNRKIESEATV